MKNLILSITTLTLIGMTSNANAACTIKLQLKKAGAKTAYTMSGDSISKKVIAKLSTQCKFQYQVMSTKQLNVMKIARLKKQLAKLTK